MSRILIIDDEPMFRELVRRFLEADGHEVIDAESGEAGLELFRRCAPDLIVTDIFMPGISGLDTIEKIRAEAPDMKIIAVSGRDGIGAATLLPSGTKGADRGLAKPFRRQELTDTIEDLLPRDSGKSG